MTNQSNPAISGKLFQPLIPLAISENLLGNSDSFQLLVQQAQGLQQGKEIDPLVDFVQRLLGQWNICAVSWVRTDSGWILLSTEEESTLGTLIEAVWRADMIWQRFDEYSIFIPPQPTEFYVVQTHPRTHPLNIVSKHRTLDAAISAESLENMGSDQYCYQACVLLEGRYLLLHSNGCLAESYFIK